MDEASRLERLEERVRLLEERMETHAPTLEEHGERLSDHDRQLADIREVQRETSRMLSALATQVSRLSDIATEQGLVLTRIDRHTKRAVEILEPRKVIVGE